MNLTAQLGNSVQLTTPINPANPVAIPPAANGAQVAATGSSCGYYRRSADVTNEIAELITQGLTGAQTISVGGVPGIESSADGTGGGNATGWALMVAYEDNTKPLRNLTLYVGAEQVASGGATQQVVQGFCTPDGGQFGGRLLLITAEGDADITGDAISIAPESCTNTFTSLKGAANPQNNFFASQIENGAGVVDTRGTFGDRNHNAANGQNVSGGRQGWDVAQIPLNDAVQNPNVIGAGINGVCVRESSTQDAYFSLGLGLELDIAEPSFANIAGALTVDPVVAAAVGATIDVTLQLENTGGRRCHQHHRPVERFGGSSLCRRQRLY